MNGLRLEIILTRQYKSEWRSEDGEDDTVWEEDTDYWAPLKTGDEC